MRGNKHTEQAEQQLSLGYALFQDMAVANGPHAQAAQKVVVVVGLRGGHNMSMW